MGVTFGGAIAVSIVGGLGALFVFGGRILCTPALDESQANSLQRPVLFLRSFEKDIQDQPSIDFSNFAGSLLGTDGVMGGSLEWQWKRILRKVGPMVAIADPMPSHPVPGGSRIKVDADWRSRVEQLMTRAVLIIIRVDESIAVLHTGLRWELLRALSPDLRGKLLLLFPETKDYAAAAPHIHRALQSVYGSPIESASDVEDPAAMTFNTDGSIQLVDRKKLAGWWLKAIEPFLERNGVRAKRRMKAVLIG